MVHGDRIQETTTTTGTGALTLGGATAEHRTFAAEIGEGVTVAYLIEVEGGGWEIAEGSLTGSTLSRTTLKSSNADAAVNLPAGTHTVSQILTAARVDAKAEAFSDLSIPENASLVLATESQSVADANPTVGGVSVVWLIVDEVVAVGQALEADTAHPLVSVTPVGQAVETDTAFAVVSTTAVGQAIETDTAFAVVSVTPVGQAVETDTALALASGFETDFSEFTVGQTPNTMTTFGLDPPTVETSAGAVGGVVLDYSTTNSGRKAALFSDSQGDHELLAQERTDSTTGNPLRLYARSQADPTNDSYFAELSDGGLDIRKYVAGSISTLDTDATVVLTANTYWRIRFRLQGTTLKAKAWDAANAEPTTGGPDNDGFQVKATDTSFASGDYGVGNFTDGIHEWDWLSMATGSGTAPVVT